LRTILAQRGGKVAGNARKETEKELGRSVVSEQNYLTDSSIDQSDRLLLSQSKLESITILGRDSLMDIYGLERT